MAQLVARIDDDLAAALDGLVAAGFVASRSDAVRIGLVRLIEHYRRAQVGARIVEGYRATPQREVGWSDRATASMIADEPW